MSTNAITLNEQQLTVVTNIAVQLLAVYAANFNVNPVQASEDIKDISTALYNAMHAQVTGQDLFVLSERTENMLKYNEQTDCLFAIAEEHNAY